MPAVVYLLPDGTSRRVDVEAGTSVMFAAVHNNVRGIDGDHVKITARVPRTAGGLGGSGNRSTARSR